MNTSFWKRTHDDLSMPLYVYGELRKAANMKAKF